MSKTILVCDFLSHATMHLPFNSGYLACMRQAFPDDTILFCGKSDHTTNLYASGQPIEHVNFDGCLTYAAPPGKSLHNPLTGTKAAKQALRDLLSHLKAKDIPTDFRFVAILGLDANLMRVFRTKWPNHSPSPVHYILHDSFGAAYEWRSRNPLYRYFDFKSEVQKPFPENHKLVVLEQALIAPIKKTYPKITADLIAFDHPMKEDERLHSPVENHIDKAKDPHLKVGFLGFCSKNKGFVDFLSVAEACTNPLIDFYAIGQQDQTLSHLDTSPLTCPPAEHPLSRTNFIDLAQQMDLILLPLSGKYRFISSGTMVDAISLLKPVVTIDNPVKDYIDRHIGPIGPDLKSHQEMIDYFNTIRVADILTALPQWQGNLQSEQKRRDISQLSEQYRRFLA